MFALAKAHCRVTSISPQTTNSPPASLNNQRMTLAKAAELKVLRSMSCLSAKRGGEAPRQKCLLSQVYLYWKEIGRVNRGTTGTEKQGLYKVV
mmetsp:Transcript_3147/g.4531  ORF Transcript_3147/g.4531 Transcript_3147/m.4531 type:complete len:93 (-) Transcript_3147:48-326(-)